MSSRQGSGKRPLYEDLDAPEAMDPVNRVGSDSLTGSTPSSSSGEKKKKKNISGHEKDEGYPPKEYTQFIREVTIAYYRVRERDMLKDHFWIIDRLGSWNYTLIWNENFGPNWLNLSSLWIA